MAQTPGFLSGVLRGALLSLAVVASVSIVSPPPDRPAASQPQDRLEAPVGSEFRRPPAEGQTVLPQVADAVPAVGAGERPTPEQNADETSKPSETTPPPRPRVADAPAAVAPPPAGEDAAAITGLPTAGTSGAAGRPEPLGVHVPAIPMPRLAFEQSRLPQVPASEPSEPAEEAGAAGPAGGQLPAAPGPRFTPAPATPGLGISGLPPEIAPRATPGSGAQGEPPGTPSGPAGTPAADPAAGPRLPTVGDVNEPSLPGVRAGTPGRAPATEAAAPRLGALARNAAPFEESGGKPLMAILLLDAGEAGTDIEVLRTFSFPVSFALDPAEPGAAARAELLRAAGFEIVALLPEGDAGILPETAPGDVETALASYFATLPQAVALFDPQPATVLASGNALARQALAFLADSGHGLLTRDQGLNSLQQAARRAGLPAATVLRDLDAAREDAPEIRRQLDRAAFRARTEGAVILLGHTYPETVRALFEWVTTAEAATLRLAPLSAVLRQTR